LLSRKTSFGDALAMQRVRAALSDAGEHGIHKCTDHAVLACFGNQLRVGHYPRDLGTTELAIGYAAFNSLGDMTLTGLFCHAVSLLQFEVASGAGLLYSGEYGVFRSGGELEHVKLWQVADRTRGRGKMPIFTTSGGRWLNDSALASFLGADGEDEVWRRASAKYVKALVGNVDVVLAYPEFDSIFRSVEGRLLFANPQVARITYHVEHPASVPDTSAGWQVFDDNGVTYARKQTRAQGKDLEFIVTVNVSHPPGLELKRHPKKQ
jgi:hypothetical protein